MRLKRRKASTITKKQGAKKEPTQQLLGQEKSASGYPLAAVTWLVLFHVRIGLCGSQEAILGEMKCERYYNYARTTPILLRCPGNNEIQGHHPSLLLGPTGRRQLTLKDMRRFFNRNGVFDKMFKNSRVNSVKGV